MVKYDESIIATNNSSIVSKRSVEKSYYPEPHFYRHFVRKPQRRSPLINRGYWLRMRAIEHTVQRFIEEQSEHRKVIINLGCGYDPLAFQFLAKDDSSRVDTLFIDIDYPQLIAKKCQIIRSTPQLLDLLQDVESPSKSSDEAVAFRSNNYLAIGCDLRDIPQLHAVLSVEFDRNASLVLMTAEVSVTYMIVGAADALIAWAATEFNDVRFCLLEQFLPGGDDHPFAKTMLQHFDKLQSPLKSVYLYPQLGDQRRRFSTRGWPDVTARSLWDLWSDEGFLTRAERLALNAVEAFDEWEEFALFAAHYFLLIAVKSPEYIESTCDHYIKPSTRESEEGPKLVSSKHEDGVKFDEDSSHHICHHALTEATGKQHLRRYGAIIAPDNDLTPMGLHGGIGVQSRTSSTSFYAPFDNDSVARMSTLAVSARMCHTITEIQNSECLLVGGRVSPGQALVDCWKRHGEQWLRVDDLPCGLYRHCATHIYRNHRSGVLVFGGKQSDGSASNQWLLWQEETGWRELQQLGLGRAVSARFGATLQAMCNDEGLLLGGMEAGGTICSDLFRWRLGSTPEEPFYDSITVQDRSHELETSQGLKSVIPRFGASTVLSAHGLLLIGGVCSKILPSRADEIVSLSHNKHGQAVRSPFFLQIDQKTSRPLLVGHSSVSRWNQTVIVGGGAVCFSFGTHWNEGVWAIAIGQVGQNTAWHLLENHPNERVKPHVSIVSNDNIEKEEITTVKQADVPKLRIDGAVDFDRVVQISIPTVFPGVELGSCQSNWTFEYLETLLGFDRQVVVHESQENHMRFDVKNFKYVKRPIGIFLKDVAAGERQYLRSLASEKPADKPAEFANDYPALAKDFVLPPYFKLAKEQLHSSVLRISGPVMMWLHYDVMANLLCQIQGTKKLLLYPPSDIIYANIAPGESSSPINVFDRASSLTMRHAHPHEVSLSPGDVLFIPPLWLHSACPTEGCSIAINIFFRNLETGYAAGRDVYGNRDLAAYEKGRKEVDKIAKAFEGLPRDLSQFYLSRLAAELQAKAEGGIKDDHANAL